MLQHGSKRSVHLRRTKIVNQELNLDDDADGKSEVFDGDQGHPRLKTAQILEYGLEGACAKGVLGRRRCHAGRRFHFPRQRTRQTEKTVRGLNETAEDMTESETCCETCCGCRDRWQQPRRKRGRSGPKTIQTDVQTGGTVCGVSKFSFSCLKQSGNKDRLDRETNDTQTRRDGWVTECAPNELRRITKLCTQRTKLCTHCVTAKPDGTQSHSCTTVGTKRTAPSFSLAAAMRLLPPRLRDVPCLTCR